jgi:rubrerythrin
MKINTILSQIGQDFTAIYECEHCGRKHKSYGYDDHYFHSEVIPEMKCPSCGKMANDNCRPLQPKYAPDEVI